MGNIHFGNHRWLTAFGLSALMSLCGAVQAAGPGNGVIVLTRDVQPFAVGNPAMHPDPNPTTANANPNARISAATNELSDGDFSRVSSGSSITRMIMPASNGSSLPGMNASNTLPGMGSSHGGGSGSSISGTINRSIEQGMRPLSNMGRSQ